MKKQVPCTCATAGETILHHGDSCPRGQQIRARHVSAVKREEKEHVRTMKRFVSSIQASAQSMAKALVDREMEELVQHAMAGRGFRLNLMICEANGMPWKPEPEVPRERLIIGPNEQ